LSRGYGQLLADIKGRVRAAQIRAGLAANRELLALYWDIGRLILDRQKAEGRGAKVIDRLSRDLQNEFPGQQGFSPRNLKYMRAFAQAWPETVIVQQPGAQLQRSPQPAPHPELPKRLPRPFRRGEGRGEGLLGVVHPPASSATEPRKSEPPLPAAPLAPTAPSVPAIVHQPGAQLPWKHHCLLLDKLAEPRERLWYAAKAVEHGWSRNVLALQIESSLHTRQGKAVTNFKTTLPPPQSDLAQQVTINCYLSAVDDRFRQPGDQPSIGLILCRAKNRIIAEYALRDLQKPIGVSDYVTRLVDTLPKAMQAAVPSIKEIESGLSRPQVAPTPPGRPY